jgi:hypothetical protein
MAEIFNQFGSGLGDRQVAPTTAADRPVEPDRDLRPAVLDCSVFESQSILAVSQMFHWLPSGFFSHLCFDLANLLYELLVCSRDALPGSSQTDARGCSITSQ